MSQIALWIFFSKLQDFIIEGMVLASILVTLINWSLKDKYSNEYIKISDKILGKKFRLLMVSLSILYGLSILYLATK
ncbi:hypothetical protein KJA13_03070, partial [Patescibacteria group bacterium]|nr:hypothetical protein [Patescibacteria group bacterium]